MPDAPPSNSGKPLVLIGGADAAYLGFLEYLLETEGFDVLRAESGDKMLKAVSDLKADVVVLDGALAESLTVDDWRRLHGGIAARQKAVIVLTDRDSQRIAAVGANGSVIRYLYVSKSSRPPEIIASIRQALAGEVSDSRQERLSYADVDMHLAAHRVRRAGRDIHLTPIEYGLLKQFLEQPERVFSREELARAAWPAKADVGGRTVDVHMGRLRRALGSAAENNLIRTVRSVGYSLSAKEPSFENLEATVERTAANREN